ncbi:MAG TPA: hypothetical protein VK176_08935 [Phycisphaerales bacterium]|nr:hypothetical protein [Phycisphaerales bacterium]
MKLGFGLVAIVCAGLALAGCKSTAGTQEEEVCIPADANAAAHAGMINAACPVVPGDDARASGVAVAYTGEKTEWKGKQVALCCKGCIGKWEKMTQAQRDEALAKVAAK